MLLTQNWDYSNNGFVGGFDTSGYGTSSDLSYFVEDGKVQAGILSDNYRDYIQMLRDWFAEGILGEPSMNMQNMFPINEYILSNQCGFSFGQSDTLSESSKQQAGGTYDMEPHQGHRPGKGRHLQALCQQGADRQRRLGHHYGLRVPRGGRKGHQLDVDRRTATRP